MTKSYEAKELSAANEKEVPQENKELSKESFLSQWDNWSSSDDFPTEFCAG